VQGLEPSDSLKDVTFTLDYPASSPIARDVVNYTVLQGDMAVEGLTDAQEEDPGGLVGRRYGGNDAPRKKITLAKVVPAAWTGGVRLSSTDGRLKVFTAQEGGTEVSLDGLGAYYSQSNLPVDLWVQGDVTSGAMRDAELHLTLNGPGGGTDTAKFTVAELHILQDGNDITRTTHPEIVGKRINLASQVLPADMPVASRQWSIPGQVIGGFTVGQGDDTNGPFTPGEVVPVGPLTEQSTEFYWKDGADGRQVQFGATLGPEMGGAVLSANAIFDVKRPEATMSTKTGTIGINEGGGQFFLALRFGDANSGGITFRCTVAVPEGFAGTSCFVQKYNEYHRLRLALGHQWQRRNGVGLDHEFPYHYSLWPTNLNQDPVEYDTPAQELVDETDRAEVQDSATMWLMFKPDGADSAWVPLRKVLWYWRASASKEAGQWQLDEGGGHSIDPTSMDTTEYPVWTFNISKNEWGLE
jgi:hypothetical protein